jgi:hypothetical protein
MTETPEPQPLQDVVDRLEEDIVDVDRAADEGSHGNDEDTTRSVPGAPEPPD